MSPEAAIATIGLSRRFGDFTAVDDVSILVRRGEIFGLIGSNGAGKSTLVKMLTTLLPPSAGEARIAGFDIVREAAEVRRHIGYVPQLLSADGSLTDTRTCCCPRDFTPCPAASGVAAFARRLRCWGSPMPPIGWCSIIRAA
jgi:ABC-type sugar transport system ATPase subunit